MKAKSLMLLCTLTVATMSTAAFSQDSNFCTDPLKKVCTDTKVQREARDKNIEKIKAEIRSDAAKIAAPRIADMKEKVPKIRLIRRAVQTFKINSQAIMEASKKRVAGIESEVINPETIAILKSYLTQAIDESGFDDVTKGNFKATVQEIVIGNFADFLEKSGLEDNAIQNMFLNPCGPDGLVDNAFATKIADKKYVLVCPGFLISKTQTPDLRERFDSLLQVITHEMGHHIDNGVVGNKLYEKFLLCTAEFHSGKLNSTEEDKKFCKKNEGNKPACDVKKTVSHGGELIADAWAIKVLNIHARKQSYSFDEASTMAVHSMYKLCGSGDEGIHPSGDYRIQTSIRMDPNFSEYLGCDNSTINSVPACTLEGAVNI